MGARSPGAVAFIRVCPTWEGAIIVA